MIDFTGKNVIITGGSRGIGRACAKLFSELNANVIITYKSNRVEAERTIAGLSRSHRNSMYCLDITKPGDINYFFTDVLSRYKSIDVLVNNAGVYLEHKIAEVDFEYWQEAWTQTINTNLIGVSNLCYFAARQMKLQKAGKIVNISSRGAFRGEPDHAAYAASKAGLNAMS